MKKAFMHSAKFLIPFTSLTPNTHKQKHKRLGLKTLQAKDTGMDENGVCFQRMRELAYIYLYLTWSQRGNRYIRLTNVFTSYNVFYFLPQS